jgi:hypothetical protein
LRTRLSPCYVMTDGARQVAQVSLPVSRWSVVVGRWSNPANDQRLPTIDYRL